MLLLDGIGQALKWFFDPQRKKAVALDDIERKINDAIRRRDKALNSDNSHECLLAIDDLMLLKAERDRLLQR